MEKTKQNSTLIIVVAVLVCVVVLFIVLSNKNKKSEQPEQKNQFAKCKVLSDSCKNSDCKLFFLCNENEAELSDCQVYDCGDNYGVRITSKAGNIQEKIREKTSPCDNKKIQDMIARCSGSFEVIEKKNCENGEATAKIKLNVKDDCEIKSATMAINDKMRIASVKRDEGFYIVSVKSCGEISNIKLIGGGGVAIEEKMEISEEAPSENIMEERFFEGSLKN